MIVALGAVALALLLLGWNVLRLSTSIKRQADAVEAHGNQLVKFGRAVYGGSSTSGQAAGQTIADPGAAERLAASSEARKSEP